MNLLVTNTRHSQALSIIEALRPYARKIVATVYGRNRLIANLSHAANSRLVDRRYYVPSPLQDWQAGNLSPENTPREEAYVQALLDICDREQIDAIYPSFDPHVYICAKNKTRFEARGVLVPVPDYDVIIALLDKYRTIVAARDAGFPHPKTYLAAGDSNFREIADDLGFPIMIRPRATSGSRGMQIVTTVSDLVEKTREVTERYGPPMLQEFIPGREKQNLYITIDRAGDTKVALCPRVIRTSLRVFRNSTIVCEVTDPHPLAARAARMLQAVGWWGGVAVQTKIDARDGIPKLMEVNARTGAHLWRLTEIGFNVPLMCLKIARGEYVEPVTEYPVGKVFIEPVEELMLLGLDTLDLAIYTLRTKILGRRPLDPETGPAGLRELARSVRDTYFAGKPLVVNPYSRRFFRDPVVSLLWWATYFKYAVSSARQIGR